MDSIQECNTDQAKHLHYTKRKSIYMSLGGGDGWPRGRVQCGGESRSEGRREELFKEKTMKKTNDRGSAV